MTKFLVEEGNVLDVPSDLLLLKYAQSFYGADEAVATRLISAGVCDQAQLRPAPADFVVVESKGAIAPKRVLFLGTPPLRSFNYNEMEVFACRAVQKIVDLSLPVRVVTTTVHGAGYGLDGGEALQRLVRGFRLGLAQSRSSEIESITFLTLDKRAERMLSAALAAVEVVGEPAEAISAREVPGPRVVSPEGADSRRPRGSEAAAIPPPATQLLPVAKRRVFVAMPFSEEFQNVYEFAIYPAVRNCGFVCERVDEAHFTGDVLNRIRGGIESADMVVADLTEGRPNVYLEVGYAWGRGVPVIFVAKKGEKLHFDVSTHRCLFYGRFTQLAKELEELIRGIEASASNALGEQAHAPIGQC